MTITNSTTRTAVRPTRPDDRTPVVAVLTAAFFDDPVTDWLWPDRERRRTVAPAVFGLYFEAHAPTEPHWHLQLVAVDPATRDTEWARASSTG